MERSNLSALFSICHLYLSNEDCGRATARKAHKQAWFTSSVELVPAQGKQSCHNAGGLPHHCYPLPHRSQPSQNSKKNLNKLRLEVSSNSDVNIGGSPLSTLLRNDLKHSVQSF